MRRPRTGGDGDDVALWWRPTPPSPVAFDVTTTRGRALHVVYRTSFYHTTRVFAFVYICTVGRKHKARNWTLRHASHLTVSASKKESKNFFELVIVNWCFQPSQPQRINYITVNTNFSPSPNILFTHHTSHQTTTTTKNHTKSVLTHIYIYNKTYTRVKHNFLCVKN